MSSLSDEGLILNPVTPFTIEVTVVTGDLDAYERAVDALSDFGIEVKRALYEYDPLVSVLVSDSEGLTERC